MIVMDKCPECGKHSVVYDDYLEKKICLIRACGWSG